MIARPLLGLGPIEPGSVVLYATNVVGEVVLQHLPGGDAGDEVFPAIQTAVIGRVYVLLYLAWKDVMQDHILAGPGAFIPRPRLVGTDVIHTIAAAATALLNLER